MGRKSRGKPWLKDSLPEDLLRLILSLLPVKSLIRFRSVCKSWRTLIADPNFVRLHLLRFPNNRHESRLFSVQYDPKGSRECAVRRYSDFYIRARLGSFGAEDVTTIVGSIDGLFMLKRRCIFLVGEISGFVLWNPSIRKILVVNSFPLLREAKEFGLGFDPFLKVYKYVRFDRDETEVYTVGKSWRKIQQRSLVYFKDVFHVRVGRAVCFMGHLFAPAVAISIKRELSVMLLFDFRTEAYATMDWPGGTDLNYGLLANGLAVADGGRALQFITLSSQNGCVWVLEGNIGRDVKSWSWVQHHTFVLTTIWSDQVNWDERFLHMDQNGVIWFRSNTKVVYFNLKTKEEKNKRKNLLDLWPYRESLILQNYAGVQNVTAGWIFGAYDL